MIIFVIPIDGNGELGRIIRTFGVVTLSREVVSYNETWSQSSYPWNQRHRGCLPCDWIRLNVPDAAFFGHDLGSVLMLCSKESQACCSDMVALEAMLCDSSWTVLRMSLTQALLSRLLQSPLSRAFPSALVGRVNMKLQVESAGGTGRAIGPSLKVSK